MGLAGYRSDEGSDIQAVGGEQWMAEGLRVLHTTARRNAISPAYQRKLLYPWAIGAPLEINVTSIRSADDFTGRLYLDHNYLGT